MNDHSRTSRRSAPSWREPAGESTWRSLEAVAQTSEFKEFLHREFPQNASEWLDPVGRRGFLKLMGASLALAGVSACTRQPTEELVPYVRQPEELVPGKPLFYATAMTMNGAGMGLLVESHEGRPTKIEGQSRASLEPGRHRSLRPGRNPRALRSGPIADAHQPRRHPTLQRLCRHGAPDPGGPERVARPGIPDPHRDDRVANARRADSTASRNPPAGEMGAVGTGRPAQRPRGQPPGVRRVRRRAVRGREGRRHSFARRRLPVHRCLGPPACPRVCVAASHRRQPRADQSGCTPSKARQRTLERRPITGCHSAPRRSRRSCTPSPRVSA